MYSQKKSSEYSFLQAKFFLIFAGAVAVILAIGVGKETYRRYQINKEIKQLETEIAALQNKNNQVSSLIQYLQDGDYAEQQARLHFGLQKPGEKVAVVYDTDKVKVTTPLDQQSNPERWYSYFFK